MNKFCKKCGKKNVSDAQFCGGCGASLAEDEVSDLPVGTRWGRVCEIGRTYILKSLVLLVSVIVFISGFFTTVKYVPQETLHNDFYSYLINGSADMEDVASMFSQKGFDQNVFNVFSAFAVGYDLEENTEQMQKLVEQVESKAKNIILKYQKRLTELTALVQQGDKTAAKQMIDLMYKIVDEVMAGMENVNLIKLEKLEAEIAYSSTTGTEGVGNLDALKNAQDLDIRMAVMVGYPVGYLFLQIVSLVFIILTMISLCRKKSARFGKFFVLYLSGCLFLLAIGQLTACFLNPVGMFCFIFALVCGALYAVGNSLFSHRIGLNDVVAFSLKGFAFVFSFVAVVLLLGNFASFNATLDKIGAVFGLSGDYGSSDEVMAFTLTNFLPSAILYLTMLALSAVVFFRAAFTFSDVQKSAATLVPLAAVTTGFGLVSYIVLGSLGMAGVLDLVMDPVVLGSVIFSGAALLFFILSGALANAYVKEKTELPAEPAEETPQETLADEQ